MNFGFLQLSCFIWFSFRCSFVCTVERLCSRGICYEIHHKKLNWMSAVRFCKSRGRNLAEIRKSKDNEYIRDLLNNHKGVADMVWLGMEKVEKKVLRYASTGGIVPGQLAYWKYLQPSTQGEKCIEFTKLGWNDQNCRSKREYICQTDEEKGCKS